MDYDAARPIGNMYSQITGDISDLIEDSLSSAGDIESVRHVLERYGLRWNDLVAIDVEAALRKRPLRFFINDTEYADRFRARRGIRFVHPEGGPVSISVAIGEYEEWLREGWDFRKKYGVDNNNLEMGYMCLREARDFYDSQEWKDRASAARYESHYRCEVCNGRDDVLHVHHRTPLVSSFHSNFDLCFRWWKLEVACQPCHEKRHKRSVRGWASYEFTEATPEEVTQEKSDLRKLSALHDQWKTCAYCAHMGYFPRNREHS